MSVRENWEMQCPGCGSDESILITATTVVSLTPDGTVEDDDGCHEWGPESVASCGCGWSGTVTDLHTAYESRTKEDVP